MSLNYMLKTGKIKHTKHAGQESLNIKEANVMDDVEIASDNEMQDVYEDLRNGWCNDGVFAVDGDEATEKNKEGIE